MSHLLEEFSINITRLGSKKYDFDYKIGDSFFAEFEASELSKGAMDVHITLENSETHIIAIFSITGSIELICDKSTREFDYPIDISEKLYFKYGEEFEEVSEEIVIIPRDLDEINLSQYIFEYISLAVPMKRVHPDLRSDHEDEKDEELVFSTRIEDEEDEEFIDPRWEALKKLKDKN
jgi:uncharacterized metal-binding protein YceD (DUF177 family)